MSGTFGTPKSFARGLAKVLLAGFIAACSGSETTRPPDTTPPPDIDRAEAMVGPTGGTVVTPSGAAGVHIPAGALGQQVLITVTQLSSPPVPGTGPLPTPLKQYPPYYEFKTSPETFTFGDSVRVGVCQVTDPSSPLYAPEQAHPRLRLAHTVGANVEILPLVGVSDFLNCTNVTASAGSANGGSAWRLALNSILRRAGKPLRATPLYAAHGGLGGKVRSFSPFGAVDPEFTPPQNRLQVAEATVCALNPAGAVFCWGANDRGEQAVPPASLDVSFSPLAAPVTAFQQLGVGARQGFCGITPALAAICWGRGGFGELGGGSAGASFGTPPTTVVGGISWANVSVQRLTACGVSTAGAGYCWGANQRGEVGSAAVPLNALSTSPVLVDGGLTFRVIVAGWLHACGITTSGDAYCWGDNLVGQLGTGTVDVGQRSPVRVGGNLKFVQLTLGSKHSCGITLERRAFCWGFNATGQLGDGTTNDRASPNPVATDLRFTYIATGSGFAGGTTTVPPNTSEQAGVAHTCALTEAGTPYCWGWNGVGQLGDGSTTDRLIPTRVAGNLQLTTIGLGGSSTCGMRNTNVWCWGSNDRGQLGNGNQPLNPRAPGDPISIQ